MFKNGMLQNKLPGRIVKIFNGSDVITFENSIKYQFQIKDEIKAARIEATKAYISVC